MSKYKCLNCGVEFSHPSRIIFAEHSTKTVETSVCPSCLDWKYDLVEEDEGKLQYYEDWLQVSHSEVKEYLQKGYGVVSHTKDLVVLAKPKTSGSKSLDKIFEEGLLEAKKKSEE